KLRNLRVGLTAAAYTSTFSRSGAPAPGRVIDWQQDAKNYQFWARGFDDGQFAIRQVRAGTYTLRAFADGVLGEFAQADVNVVVGQPLDLGELTWKPVRHGK